MIYVIGIDPAPSKKSTVYDGDKFKECDYKELQSYLEGLKKEEKKKILICWDAPLSFNPDCTSPLTKRDIEKFFSKNEWCSTPKGISVLGYAGCPHWTISQYLLGYPKLHNLDEKFNPPFKLIFDKDDISHSVTEVHPAVAIWLWTKDKTRISNWKYKKEQKIFDRLVEILIEKQIIPFNLKEDIKDDDHLDAYIAWKLGVEWIRSNGNVDILGDNTTGSFLLPYNKNVFEKFEKFEVK